MPTPPGASTVPAGTRQVPVLGGVPFEITLVEEVPNDPATGLALHFQVARDVQAGGAVVILKGTPVAGEVLEPGKKGILGRGGKPSFRVTEVTAVDGTKLKLKASPGRSGDKNERNIEPSRKRRRRRQNGSRKRKSNSRRTTRLINPSSRLQFNHRRSSPIPVHFRCSLRETPVCD